MADLSPEARGWAAGATVDEGKLSESKGPEEGRPSWVGFEEELVTVQAS